MSGGTRNAGETKTALRDDAYRQLLKAIVQGEFAAKSPLREVALAEQLKISRTPIREALFRLQHEGLVKSSHSQGFYVAELSEQDVNEIYPLLGMLERFALENSRPISSTRIKRLRQLNGRMLRSTTRGERIGFDAKFHSELTGGCSNQRVQHALANLRSQAVRYEWVYGNAETLPSSHNQHEKVIEALEKGKQRRAAVLLEKNFVDCIPQLLLFVGKSRNQRFSSS